MDGVDLKHRPKAVFFDWDGTLVNSLAFLTKAHNHAKTQMGLPLFHGEHEFQPYLGMPRDALYLDIYGDRAEEAKVHFEAYVKERHTHDVKPIKATAEFLGFLYMLDIPCAVISNKRSIFLNPEIDTFGWRKYFRSVVGAGDASADKPSAAPLFLALEKSGLDVTPEDIWYVGDTQFDMSCAHNAGAKGILVKPPYEQETDFSMLEPKPHLICQNIETLQDFIGNLPANSKSPLL